MRRSRVRARRIVSEFLLIVTGVLTALAVDAWWQGHTDRQREALYLHQLRSDAQDNRRRLEDAIALERGQLEIARALLSAVRTKSPIPLDSARAWSSGQTPFPFYSDTRLLDGTMIALVETGDLNILRDPGIRAATIVYLGQLRADQVELARGIVPFQEHADRLWSVMERTWTPGNGAGEDEATRALLAIQRHPDTAVILRLVQENIGNRLWYLNALLEATKEYIRVMGRETTGGRRRAGD